MRFPSGLGLILTLAGSLLASGCRERQPLTTPEAPPFVFRALDLNQRAQDGSRDWDLTSPEARYDLNSRTIRARRPTGILYRDDKPAFSISADLATVLNDGELVVLEGAVQLKQLQEESVLIQGNRLVWTPEQSTMVLSDKPEAVNQDSRLVAQSLTFQQTTSQLVFSGPTVLYRWQKQRSLETEPDTSIVAANGQWNLETGQLTAEGPIKAERQSGRQLTATGLRGNTKSSLIELSAPVQVTLEEGQGTVTAGPTRWQYAKKQLSSSAPFVAELRQGSVRGGGFTINEATTTVIIPQDCRLNQPGEVLTAARCSWNWTLERVIADGDVVLRRDELNQVTRAARLEGFVGDDGSLQFGAPGQRVRSQIKLNQDPAGSSQGKRSPAVSF